MAKTFSKVGDLLVEAGLLSHRDLQEGMERSATLGLPIGKTMVMSGTLKDKTVRAAVLIQSMLKDGLIDREMAVNALSSSDSKGIPVEDCLLELGWRPPSDAVVNKVGQLLVDAQAMTADDLKQSLDHVQNMGLPLGRVLVLTGKVKGSVVWCALNAQMFLRDKKINRAQAIKAVRAASERQLNFEQGLREQGLEQLVSEHRIKLGELLVLSGLVGQEDILGAVEESLSQEQSLGQVLVNLGLLTQERLADALKLQEMTENAEISPLQAVDLLRSIHNTNQPLSRAIAEMGLLKAQTRENVRLGELLQQAGWVTEQEIEEAVNLATKNSHLLGRMLVSFGFIDEGMLYSSLRCQFLVREGFIKAEDAVTALHFSQRTRCTLDHALNELGYYSESALPKESSS